MSKTITSGMLSEMIHGIKINTGRKCDSSNYTNSASRSVAYVVMHYTGNPKDTAKANAAYFQGSGRKASAHFFVDDENIYQSVELRDKAWHCGTSGTYYHAACRNANSIGVEMCCTAGSYKISDQTKENAAYVCAYLCKLIGIKAAQVDTYVLRHWDVTHKSCPAQMTGKNNAEWTAFKAKVKKILGGDTGSSRKETEYYAKYTGSSAVIDTVFKAVGVPVKYRGSYTKRKPVAKANGISDYSGTAAQNTKLISLAKAGKLKKP